MSSFIFGAFLPIPQGECAFLGYISENTTVETMGVTVKASDDRQGDKTDEAEARQDEFLLPAKPGGIDAEAKRSEWHQSL